MIVGVMLHPAIGIRPATAGDFEAIERIAAANDEATTAPSWPGYLYLEHLLTAGTLCVAVRGGVVVGYAGAMVVGGRRPAAHVTDLFVDPGAQGRGVGSRLLKALMAVIDVPDWTTSSSADPRALTLYARAGMVPLWPVLYVDAPLGAELVERRQDVAVTAVAAEAAAGFELRWSGRDFSVHYRHWAARPGATVFRVELAGRTAAVGIVREGRLAAGRTIDHLAVAPSADPGGTLLAALSSAVVRGPEAGAGGDAQARLRLAVPGPNPALPYLLALGFRILDQDTFCASDSGLVDPLRVVPDPSFG